MKWQELRILVSPEFVEPVSYLFGRYGRGLSMEDAVPGQILLRTYLPTTSKQRRTRIEVGTKLIQILEPLAVLEVKELEKADWETAWKAHFTLLKIGRKLVIKPSWISYEPAPDEVVIELDPGMAFGTGYHPTTKMVLEALEDEVRPGMHLVDLGAGSGILTIAALRLGAAHSVALDIDQTAVQTARKNFRDAGLRGYVSLVRGSLPHRAAAAGSFDLAAANISGKIIMERGAAIYQALKPGGRFLASGLLVEQAAVLCDSLAGEGFRRERSAVTDDWTAIIFSKPA